MAHTPTNRSAGLEYWLRHFGMPEENIEKCVTQIAQGYGACRYLEGVQIGAEAVNELAEQEQPSIPSNLDEAAEEYMGTIRQFGDASFTLYADVDVKNAFKAGAEWMAGQGVSMIINDDTEWADVDSFIHKNVSGGSTIQIKKK